MQISKFEWVAKEDRITQEKENFPYTFFSLDLSDKLQYNAFLVRHAEISGRMKELNQRDRASAEKVFREAYQRKLEAELQEQKLVVVE